MQFPIHQLEAYNQAEISIHRVSQILALTGVNLVDKKTDDSHTNLAWETARSAIVGRYFQLSNQTMRLIFLLKEKELAFETEKGQLVASISLDYSDHESLMMWWKMQLQELGVREELVDTVHYDLPDTEDYKTVEIADFDSFLKPWITLRVQANQVFEQLNKAKNISSEIRIWPHHFDTGVYYPIKADSHAIGAGMAMADTLQPEPYYYMYGWVKNREIDFNQVPDLDKGQWLIDGDWKGAVLPVSELKNLENLQEVNKFFNQAFDFLNAALANL